MGQRRIDEPRRSRSIRQARVRRGQHDGEISEPNLGIEDAGSQDHARNTIAWTVQWAPIAATA